MPRIIRWLEDPLKSIPIINRWLKKGGDGGIWKNMYIRKDSPYARKVMRRK